MNESYIRELLYRINVNSDYSTELLMNAFKEILYMEDVNIRSIMLGSLLTSIMAKNPTEDEIVALLKTAFSMDNYDPLNRPQIEIPNSKCITIVGSGKKGIKTINISTASALLAASMGAYVAKPGSSSTSSLTGSADFMELLGANTHLLTHESMEILKKCGFSFFKIENVIPKFDSVYGGNFYVPHALSFGLAALVCPISTDVTLYGLAHPNVELSLNVLKRFNVGNAMVVSSTDDNIHFIDEMGVFGKTRLIGTKDGISNGELVIFNPLEELKLPKYTSNDIKQGQNQEENIKYILDALAGHGKMAHEDIICINCANILYLSNLASNLVEGYHLSKTAIKTGKALEKLSEYIELTGSKTNNIKKILKR